MFLKDFPDLQWLKRQIQTQFQDRTSWTGQALLNAGFPSVIINTKVKQHAREKIKGPLSLFICLSGEVEVNTENKCKKQKPGFFRISNAGDEYSLFYGQQSTETFNIHFGEALLLDLARFVEQGSPLPDGKTGKIPLFLSHIYPISPFLLAWCRQVKTLANHHLDPMFLEEKLCILLPYLLGYQKDYLAALKKIKAVKHSTREEIQRRIMLAKDFIHTYFCENINLDLLSEVSCMSKFYLVRSFQQCFGISPYQYIQNLKLKEARRLLYQEQMPASLVSEIVGFENPSAFSRFFKLHTGTTPKSLGKN